MVNAVKLHKKKMPADFHLTFIVDTKLNQDERNWISSGKVGSAAQQLLFSIKDLGFLQCPRMTGQICKVICLLFSWDHEEMC